MSIISACNNVVEIASLCLYGLDVSYRQMNASDRQGEYIKDVSA